MFRGFCPKHTLKDCTCFAVSISFLNIIIGLLVFVNVIQICNDTDYEIKYQTLTLEAESVELSGFILQSIHDDMQLACYDFVSSQLGTILVYSPIWHKCILLLPWFDLLTDKLLLILLSIREFQIFMEILLIF
jgi:hypothetical protein